MLYVCITPDGRDLLFVTQEMLVSIHYCSSRLTSILENRLPGSTSTPSVQTHLAVKLDMGQTFKLTVVMTILAENCNSFQNTEQKTRKPHRVMRYIYCKLLFVAFKMRLNLDRSTLDILYYTILSGTMKEDQKSTLTVKHNLTISIQHSFNFKNYLYSSLGSLTTQRRDVIRRHFLELSQ